MSINARAVIRVIISGEWIWVERGTFDVRPFEFIDDNGDLLAESDELAYFFTSTQGDPYFGPLRSVSLMKLDNQILEETDERLGGVLAAKSPAGLPAGDPVPSSKPSGSNGRELFAGDEEPEEKSAPTIAPAPTPAPEPKPSGTPLFADDAAVDDTDDAPSRRGGLF